MGFRPDREDANKGGAQSRQQHREIIALVATMSLDLAFVPRLDIAEQLHVDVSWPTLSSNPFR